MFADPPPQLRQALGHDEVVITVGGVRQDHIHQRHPVAISVLAIALGALLISHHPIWAGAIALAMVWGYQKFSTGDPEQTEFRVRRDRILLDDLEIRFDTIDAVRAEPGKGNPLLLFDLDDGTTHTVWMQLEPVKHAVWIAEQINRARTGRGTAKDVPRQLKDMNRST